MFKRLTHNISVYIQQETASVRWERMLAGAFYGFIAATAYALTISTINAITLPGQHLGVDGSRLLLYWGGLSVIMVPGGMIVGWFTEDYEGITLGGMIIIVILMITILIVPIITRKNPVLVAQSMIAILTLIGAIILIACGLRLAISRHIQFKQAEIPKRRTELLGGLAAVVLFAGMIPGVLARYDHSTVEVIRSLNSALSNVATDPSLESRFLTAGIPARKAHGGKGYRIYPRPSSSSVGAYDITVRFQDGFTFTCFVSTENLQEVVYFDFTSCTEGSTIFLP
jgi:hypothetical protein